MLGKLLSYEFRATSRTFLPLYGTMILLSVVNRFTLSMLETPDPSVANLISGIMMFAFVAVISVTAFMTIFIMAQRFYKNLLGDEGYLMFTLPVPMWQNISAKLIASTVWSILSGIVTLLSIFIVAFQPRMIFEFRQALQELRQELISMGFPTGVHLAAFSVEAVLFILLSLASSVLVIYASLAVGHLAHRHRVMFSFAAFIGFSIVSQIISFLGILPFRNFDMSAFLDRVGFISAGHLFLGGSLLVMLVFSAAYFAITNVMLKRHLNLE